QSTGTIPFKEVCSSGHVIFTWLDSLDEESGYRLLITGFRQTGLRGGVVDTRGDGYVIQGDAVACEYDNPPPPREDCFFQYVAVRARDATKAGGRQWMPVSAHRHVIRQYGRDGQPQYWDFDVALQPCDWEHAEHHEQVDGFGGTFGNWCSPQRLWFVDPNP